MSESDFPYLHGFSEVEQDRLYRQGRFAEHSIYQDVDFSRAKKILEVGCGVGAQTEILLRRFPELFVHGVDRSDNQLAAARKHLAIQPQFQNRYTIEKMDATRLEFSEGEFDGAFLCWILEHVSEPSQVLAEVRRVLRPGGRVFVTEVMNSTFFLDPYSPNTWRYWMAYNDYQLDHSGDPFVGVKLGNLLLQQGFREIQTNVKTWHFDNRTPGRRKEVIAFWTELILSAADQLLRDKYVDQGTIDGMKIELDRVAFDKDAVFYFSFMQASARV
ncbi:MAG: methyltransferase domain-containing protein [Bdellovibrionales bacterium]|nr:methyltransferase domain-containing protein [Bdellovibrionales bacterium]